MDKKGSQIRGFMAVDRVGENGVRRVPSEELVGLLKWIHWQLPGWGLEPILQQVLGTSPTTPCLVASEFLQGGHRLAASYFTALPGRVATLGGFRAIPGCESQAAQLLQHLAAELRPKFPQIQAIIPIGDTATSLPGTQLLLPGTQLLLPGTQLLPTQLQSGFSLTPAFAG